MPTPTDEPTSTPPTESLRRPGPAPARLAEAQQAAFLDMLAQGKGVDQAVRALRVSYRSYLNTRRADPIFSEEADSCRRAADQSLDHHAVEQILRWDGECSFRLLIEVWRRRDRAYYLNLARKDRARERAEDRRDRLRWERFERKIRIRAERDSLVRRLDDRVLQLQAEVDRLRGGQDPHIAELRTGELTPDREVADNIADLRLLKLPRLADEDRNELLATTLPELTEDDLDRLRAKVLPRLDDDDFAQLRERALPRIDDAAIARYRELAASIGSGRAS